MDDIFEEKRPDQVDDDEAALRSLEEEANQLEGEILASELEKLDSDEPHDQARRQRLLDIRRYIAERRDNKKRKEAEKKLSKGDKSKTDPETEIEKLSSYIHHTRLMPGNQPGKFDDKQFAKEELKKSADNLKRELGNLSPDNTPHVDKVSRGKGEGRGI